MSASTIVFDTETYAIDKVAEYIEPATAPAHYKQPDVIAKYIEQANKEQIAKAALDLDLGRIVAIGVQVDQHEPEVRLARTEADEREALVWFWSLVGSWKGLDHPTTLIGFNIVGFDLPFLARRSLYLNVPAPLLPLNKYRHPGIEDLLLRLSYDGAQKYRSLDFYARRFNLSVTAQPHTGADIAELVNNEDWAAVRAHCLADIRTTVALARRIGVLPEPEVF